MAAHVLAKYNPCIDTAASSGHCACGCYKKSVRLFLIVSVCTCLFCLACCLITISIVWRPVHCKCMDQAVGHPQESSGHVLVQVNQEQFPMWSKVDENEDATFGYLVRQKREKKKKPKPCDCSMPKKELNKKCKKSCKIPGNPCVVQAAHYVAWNNVTFAGFNHTFSKLCKYLPKHGGSVCRNGTFLLNTSSTNLTMFREADWVKKDSNPFNFDPSSGKFIVKQSGLYLVYSQVLFNDKWPKQAIRLMHGTKTGTTAQSLTCFHGIAGASESYASCGIMGVFQMIEGDYVLVQSLYRGVRIELNGNHTYFGGVLLTPNHNQS